MNTSYTNLNIKYPKYNYIKYCKNMLIKNIAGIAVILLFLVFYFSPSYKNKIYSNSFVKINPIFNSYILKYNKFNISISKITNLINYGIYYLDNFESKCNVSLDDSILGIENFTIGYLIPKNNIKDCSINIQQNIIPQYLCFNKIWKEFEDYIENNYKYNYIITAPQYNNGISPYLTTKSLLRSINFLSDSDYSYLIIPTGFYKIVISNNSKLIKSFFIKHNLENCNKNLLNIINYNIIPYFITSLDNSTS
jgi:DNA/RNA endonuclease G (NUC1)